MNDSNLVMMSVHPYINFLCLYSEFYRNNLFVDFASSFHAASVPVSHVLRTAKFTYMYISLFRDFPSLYI